MSKILVIEDDAAALGPLLRGIEAQGGAVCHVYRTLSEALEQIYDNKDWTAAVFDLHLSTGPLPHIVGSSAEFDAFLEDSAGLLLATAFQHRFPGHPMVVWSFWPETQSLLPFIQANVCHFFDKKDLSLARASSLAAFLTSTPISSSALTIMWDSLLAQPNVAGIGIDIKKLLEGLHKHYQR